MFQNFNNAIEDELEEEAQHRAVALGYFDPLPKHVKADTRGLPPARAKLARHLAWERELANEIIALNQRAAELRLAIDAPAKTTAELAKLHASDMARLRTSTGPVVFVADDPTRDHLKHKLRCEKQEAEMATRVVSEIEREIRARKIGIEFLQGGRTPYVDNALAESAQGLVVAYLDRIAEMQPILRQLWGLDVARRFRNGDDGCSASFPEFRYIPGLQGPAVKVEATGPELQAAAAPWRTVGEAWLRDPKLDPRPIYEGAKCKGKS